MIQLVLVLDENQARGARSATAVACLQPATVVITSTVEQCIHSAQQSQADLIVVSCDADAAAVDRNLRALRDAGLPTPVVVLAGAPAVDDATLMAAYRWAVSGATVVNRATAAPVRGVENEPLPAARSGRMPAEARTADIHIGELVMRPLGRTLYIRGEEVALRGREFDLLLLLARNASDLVSRPQMLREVWNLPATSRTRVVHMAMSTLRRKLQSHEEAGLLRISTVFARGYRLDIPTAPPVGASMGKDERPSTGRGRQRALG